jgi:hypothetical protein
MKIASASKVLRSRDLWLRHGQNKKIVFVALAISVALPARLPHAEPPANADPRLAPFFESLKTKEGGNCCGAADCREVLSESPDNSPTGHWRAFIDRGTFGPTAPNDGSMFPTTQLTAKKPPACDHRELSPAGARLFTMGTRLTTLLAESRSALIVS